MHPANIASEREYFGTVVDVCVGVDVGVGVGVSA
jgi:hypothetical protein